MSTHPQRSPRRPNRTRQQQPQSGTPQSTAQQPRTKSDHEKAMELAQQRFQTRTSTATVAYDNAVEEAMLTRDKATELLHQRTIAETVEIDNNYNAAVTAAWKSMMTNKDSARQERDQELDDLRHAMTPSPPQIEIHDDVTGETRQYDLVSPDAMRYTQPESSEISIEDADLEEPVLCLRCNTTNALGQWTADGNIRCPNCGATGTLAQEDMAAADGVHIADATEVINTGHMGTSAPSTDPLPSSRGE
jgi:hypothetical protein